MSELITRARIKPSQSNPGLHTMEIKVPGDRYYKVNSIGKRASLVKIAQDQGWEVVTR